MQYMGEAQPTRCGSEDLPVEAQMSGARAMIVNGEAVTTTASTLDQLLAERGLAGMRVATARNGDFVPERTRAATALEAGDRIEIVSPRHGG
jgi:sulfur carrier protein